MSSADTSLPEEITAVTDRKESDALTKDVIFELLKNRRRREVLKYLLDAEETVTLGELAEQIAAWENDTTVNALNSDQRKRVYVALYQTHLPKMDDAGIIDYDQDRGLVDLADNADLLVMYLETDTPDRDYWHLRYAATSVIGLLIVGAAAAGAPVVGSIPMAVLAPVVVGTFVVLSAIHVLSNHRFRRVVDEKLERIE